MHLLVSTLGQSWAVIPELYGMFTTLYDGQPVVEHSSPPEAIWIISTEQAYAAQQHTLGVWAARIGVSLRSFLLPCSDLETQADVQAMRELIFRVLLHASEASHELTCSLAGGRKTMSADLQEGAGLFGCQRLLHILANGRPTDWPPQLREPDSSTFLRPLPPDCRPLLVPIILPGHQRADLLDVVWQDRPAISADRFPLDAIENRALSEEISARRRDTGLLSNFISAIEQDEHHENWRSLYRLPPRLIERLRQTPLGPAHGDLLTALPKADLHHHIGGSLDLDDQRQVAEAIWCEMPADARDQALRLVRSLDWSDPQARWRDGLKQGTRAHNCAAVFRLHTDAQLRDILYPAHRNRVALSTRDPPRLWRLRATGGTQRQCRARASGESGTNGQGDRRTLPPGGPQVSRIAWQPA